VRNDLPFFVAEQWITILVMGRDKDIKKLLLSKLKRSLKRMGFY